MAKPKRSGEARMIENFTKAHRNAEKARAAVASAEESQLIHARAIGALLLDNMEQPDQRKLLTFLCRRVGYFPGRA